MLCVAAGQHGDAVFLYVQDPGSQGDCMLSASIPLPQISGDSLCDQGSVPGQYADPAAIREPSAHNRDTLSRDDRLGLCEHL